MKEKEAKQQEYLSDLEEKVVELSLKLKNKNVEIREQAELNSLIFKKLIHNLKNPIGVSFSFSEMMLQDFRSYSEDRMEKHLTIVHNSSKFSIDLLNSFAQFTRYQLLDLTFNFFQHNIVSILENVVEKLKPLASEKGILLTSYMPNFSIDANCDKVEMELALTNILHNAIRYSNESSEIKVRVSDLKDSIEIEVEDQGIGISEDNLSQVCGEFFVVNTYSSDTKKCIGLGLPIAKKIMKLHHGSIQIDSVLGKGTTVIVSIPK